MEPPFRLGVKLKTDTKCAVRDSEQPPLTTNRARTTPYAPSALPAAFTTASSSGKAFVCFLE